MMKTINDLVDRLNSYVAYGEFYIRKGKNDNYLLCKRYIEGEDATLFDLAKEQPYWSIHQPLGAMHNQVQKDIMDFVYGTDKAHWFDEPEKKYNIIIGKDSNHTVCLNVYRKKFYFEQPYDGDVVLTDDRAQKEDLKKEEYQFTESEIEDLKSTLPDNMAKIVELGKVEVK